MGEMFLTLCFFLDSEKPEVGLAEGPSVGVKVQGVVGVVVSAVYCGVALGQCM